MFGFRPARSSPPAKPVGISQQRLQVSTNSADVSRSSAFSAVPELAGLSVEEVELVDAIIERAGPTATTFLGVFKAYNDILLERGLDPHEVVYYGKLLKLGTLKGSSWKEKWDAIKVQNGYGMEPQRSSVKTEPVPIPRQPLRSGIVAHSRPGPSTILSDDLFSSASALRVSQTSETDDGSVLDGLHTFPASSTVFPSRKGYSPSDLTNNSLGLEVDEDIPRPFSTPASTHALSRRAPHHIPEPVASTPPSYRDLPVRSNSPVFPTKKIERLPPPKTASAVSRPTERRNSAINEEDAWKKVKMMQDEREADRFREEKLIERCFDVWRQGFQWTITANEQVGTARDNILLQRFLLRWYERAASRRDFYKQVDAVSNRLCQRAFFRIWKHRFKERLKEKQQAEWRQDMRMKIQLVRQKRDTRILREAWSEWAQSHKLILAEQHFSDQVVVRLFRRWKTRLRGVYEKEAVADDMFRSRMDGVVEMYWDHWRSYTELARMEKMMSKRVGLRIMGDALDTWNKKTHDIQAADAFHNVIVVKNAIRSWKAARDRIRSLEARVNRHISHRDDILLRAAMRVWKARERGKLLEKVKAFRLTKAAWAVWKAQLDSQRKLEDMALRFSTRLQSSSAKIAFHSWRQVLSAQQSAQLLAMQKHSVWVYRRTLLQWRLNLHKQLKMAKKARLAEKYLVLRRSWNLLKEKYCERIADKKRRASEQLMVKNLFQVWLQRSQKLRHTRLAEEIIQDQVRKRVLTKFLTHWTNRVIEIKLLELEVAQRNEAALLIHFFKRWKKVRARHVEELGLMQSYQDIKREDNVRKIFHKWLTATRTVRLRCNVLEQKEQQIKREAIIMAWDRWRTLLEMKRERFQDERLRPLELQFRFQNKEALKYRAFATWFSKTQALPAIHFDAQRVKTKYWRAWRSAMPRALQAKKAREVDKNALLKKSLEKWLQVYRTKLTLKAVARARYFPAPSAPSSRPSPFSRLPPLSFAPRSNTSRNIFPRRAARSASPDEEDPGPSNNSPASRFVGLASRLAVPTRARSEVSPTRTLISAPRTRASSPARSTRSSIPLPSYLRDRSPVRPPSPSSAGGEERSSLWQEIQDVRRKSQTPSEILRASRKPP